MAETSDSSPRTGIDREAVSDIECLLRTRFPDADLKIERYADYLDVRVVPNGVASELEASFDGVTVTPYNAFRMTVQLE